MSLVRLSIHPSILSFSLSTIPPPTTCCIQTRSFAAVAERPQRTLRINFHNEVEKHFWAIVNMMCRHGNSCGETLPRQKRTNEGGSATTGRVTDSPSDGAIKPVTSACVPSLHLQRTVCCHRQNIAQPSAGKCIFLHLTSSLAAALLLFDGVDRRSRLNCWKTLSQPCCRSDLDTCANLP